MAGSIYLRRMNRFTEALSHSQLPQRGHAKSKRTDLRIVGLALLVTADFHVPLFWKVYPGNQHDSVTFSEVLKELTGRYRDLTRDCEDITLVFDKGNNSAGNQIHSDCSATRVATGFGRGQVHSSIAAGFL